MSEDQGRPRSAGPQRPGVQGSNWPDGDARSLYLGAIEAMLKDISDRQMRLEKDMTDLIGQLQVGPASHDRRIEKCEERDAAFEGRLAKLEGAREAEQKAASIDKRTVTFDVLKWILGLAIAAAIGGLVAGLVKAEPAPSSQSSSTQPRDAGPILTDEVGPGTDKEHDEHGVD